MRLAVVALPKKDRPGSPVPLYIRVTHAGRRRYVSLQTTVPEADWNPRRAEVRRGRPNAKRINDDLATWLRRAEDAAADVFAEQGRHVTADELKAVVELAVHPERAPEPEPVLGVVAYSRRVQDEKRAAGKVGTALVYGTALTHFEDTLGERKDIAFEAVTPDLLRRHHARLSAPEPAGLGHRVNYATKQMRTLRAILRRAATDGVPGAATAADATRAITYKTERVEKPRLGIDDVLKLEAAREAGTFSGRARDVLDWWLFAFYVGGMRFGDLAALRWEHVEWEDDAPVFVRWRMRKTGDAQGVPVLDVPASILVDWRARTGERGEAPSPFVFGMLTDAALADPEALHTATHRWSAIARKHLRPIAAATETAYVGFHGARHSLAQHLARQGVPVHVISQILGHSSVKITIGYLASMDRGAVEDAMRGAFGQGGGS